MIDNANALRCPHCGCAEFIEFVTSTTSAYARFLTRDHYPVVDEPFDEDSDAIWFECSECGRDAETEQLVEPAKEMLP
jgi:DNA-directed RNA polymerase subunit RPC12/RpoP